MGSNNSLEWRIRIKIALLYLIIILYVAGVYFYSGKIKENIDKQKEEIAEYYNVLYLSDQLTSTVQQTQDIIKNYLFSPNQSQQLKFDSISTELSQQIANLKQMSNQRSENIYLEDIDSLLIEKKKVVDKLIQRLRPRNPIIKIDEKIETIDEIIKDSVHITTNIDTTIVIKEKEKKKDLWSRFKNLIKPVVEQDTIFLIAEVEQETKTTSRVDTVISSDLKNVTKEASKSYSTQISGIERQVRELILAEQNISLQISKLLSRFFTETTLITQKGIQENEALTNKVFSFAISIGILSIFLILIIILFIANDLNKGRKARLALAAEKQLSETLMESRHKLLLSVSHDIKTPLSSIMGYLEMWNSDVTTENMKRQLHSAQNSGQHILNMLSNLLEFSRLEQKKAVLHNTRFDLIELIQEIIQMFQPLAEEKKLNINFENQAGCPFIVNSDYTVLKQILNNIISNAIKYTKKGGINIKLTYQNELMFAISDTGVGMSADEIQEIFKPFSRIQNQLTTEGSGFGMYVTQGLIHSLKGKIEIESEKDKGTSIFIKLPIHPLENDKLKIDGSNTPVHQVKFNKILIFEDDIPLGNMIKEFLVQNGFKVKVCDNSQDVNGFINHLSLFDIALTDMNMINISGTEILQKIRKKDTDIPVWLMTANDDYSSEKAISEGFSGLVKKPIQLNKLIDILSGESNQLPDSVPIFEKFNTLSELFGDDTESIKDVLWSFVESSQKDTETLNRLIDNSDFKEAQKVCHKMHPFLNQIGAKNLTGVLIKMDSLRGQEETSYPNWKTELSETLIQIKLYADKIKEEYMV